MPMIALLDYGSGNLRSVHKAFLEVGANVRIVQQPEGMKGARGVVLPGVGAFDDCIHAMQKQELLEASREFIKSGRPFLESASAIRPYLRKAKSSTVARRAWASLPVMSCVLRTGTASKFRKSAGTNSRW